MLIFKKIKGNLVHKTAVINWKNISIGKNNIIGITKVGEDPSLISKEGPLSDHPALFFHITI